MYVNMQNAAYTYSQLLQSGTNVFVLRLSCRKVDTRLEFFTFDLRLERAPGCNGIQKVHVHIREATQTDRKCVGFGIPLRAAFDERIF